MTEPSHSEILQWLKEERPGPLRDLYAWADAVRKQNVGDAVHLRGLIEISSHCRRQCMYCGLRKANRSIERYRMARAEIEDCARMAVKLGYGTVVIQAGEDDAIANRARFQRQSLALLFRIQLLRNNIQQKARYSRISQMRRNTSAHGPGTQHGCHFDAVFHQSSTAPKMRT